MSVQLITDSGEPYCVPTVNLGNSIGNDSYMQPFAAFMDVNNCPDVIRKFEDIGLIEPYVRAGEQVTASQGFVEYPLYSFSRSMLEHFDKDGTAVAGERVICACRLHEARKEFVFTHLSAMDESQIDPRKTMPEACRLIHRHSTQILIQRSLYLLLQILMRCGRVTQQMLCSEEILKTSLVNVLKRGLRIVVRNIFAHRTDSLLFG